MKNARCRKKASCGKNTRCRKYSVLEVRGSPGVVCIMGVHGPRVPVLSRTTPATGHTFFRHPPRRYSSLVRNPIRFA